MAWPQIHCFRAQFNVINGSELKFDQTAVTTGTFWSLHPISEVVLVCHHLNLCCPAWPQIPTGTLRYGIRAQVWSSNAFYLIARHLLDLELLDCGCLWVLTDASRQTPYLVPVVRAQGLKFGCRKRYSSEISPLYKLKMFRDLWYSHRLMVTSPSLSSKTKRP